MIEISKSEVPTKEELQAAIKQAKAPPHNFTSTQIKCNTNAIEIVRYYLSPRFVGFSTDELRIMVTNLSRSGDEPGSKKRTDEQKQSSTLRSLVNAFPSNGEHTQQYDNIHASSAYKTLRDKRKQALDYRCQLCCRYFLGHQLEGHILDYSNWEKPGMLIILCRDECHPIADSLRRRGKKVDSGEDLPLWTQEI